MEFLLKLLIFFFLFIFLKYNKKNTQMKSLIKNEKMISPIFMVINDSSKIHHIKFTNDGELAFFKCEGQIVYMGNFSDYNFLLNDDFYQLCYIKYINKNAERRRW